ncbi:MAG: helix-turn-helix transcriptional regulator [Roseiflexaceae bacterium]|nr:helix-turn-helix transcriptional regulator [Roseiflexaceae bacterium]
MFDTKELCVATETFRCPVEFTIDVLGGKWKPLILYYLLGGTKRFGGLQRLLPHVTRRMLTQHLRELERDGIVHRKVYSQVPPMVEYSLTELGRSLEPVLLLMLDWGQRNNLRVDAHRQEFAARGV